MTGVGTIAVQTFRSMLGNVKMLLWVLLAPLVVITLMYLVFDVKNETDIRIGVPDTMDPTFTEGLPEDVEVLTYELTPVLDTLLDTHELDAFVSMEDKGLNVTYKNEDPPKTAAVKQAIETGVHAVEDERLKGIMAALPEEAEIPKIEIETSFLYGDSASTYFEKMFPILTGLVLFFFVMVFTCITLFRERTSGTLERVLATSIRRSEVILGYLTGLGLFVLLGTVMMVLYAIYLLDVTIAGSMIWVFVIYILVSFSGAAAGMLIALLSKSEVRMMVLILLVTVPQIFLSGLIPFDYIGDWFNNIGYGFPLRYAGDALTEVMIKGNSWSYIWNELLALALFIIGFTVLSILGLKKHRRV